MEYGIKERLSHYTPQVGVQKRSTPARPAFNNPDFIEYFFEFLMFTKMLGEKM